MAQSDQNRPSNRETFATWMTEHRGIVFKIIRGFTNNSADADDLHQNIALAIWRSVPSFRGEAKVSTWIWRIALNQAISWRRGQQVVNVDLDEVVELATTGRAEDGLSVEQIYDAIRALAPIDRSLIMLSLEGYRYNEIAEITGLTSTNVGARLSRTRTRLAEHLEEVA